MLEIEWLTDAVIAVPQQFDRLHGEAQSPGFEAGHRYVYREAVRAVYPDLLNKIAAGMRAVSDRYKAELTELESQREALLKSTMDGGLALLDPGEDEELDTDQISELASFEPTRIDGVNGPANGAPALVLKARGAPAWRTVSARMVKSQAERRFGLYVAYPVNKPDAGVALDGFRDFAGPQAVEDAAWDFMRKGQQIGLFHMPGTDGAGVCVESSVYRGPDWRMTAADGSTQTIVAGDWLVGVIWTPEAWEMVKSGHINGVSMQGSAVRRTPSPEALAGLRKSNAAKRARKLAKSQARAVSRAMQPMIVEMVTQRCAEVAAARSRGAGYR